MNEIILDEFTFLVVETDIKGVITFTNDSFCKLTGYALDDLIGQLHSLIRHADVPKTVFQSLWETIQKEEIWTGVIKNKVKNGDYYWAYITIYPMETCNGGKGYMSCQRKLSKEDREEYEALYKVLKS